MLAASAACERAILAQDFIVYGSNQMVRIVNRKQCATMIARESCDS
jgi:hypothetical protein